MMRRRHRIDVKRDVDEVCVQCGGAGQRVYGSTSTWRGGVGGCAMTVDVCDRCWGSGDTERPWPNLRELEQQKRADACRMALSLFADRVGVRLRTLEPCVEALISKLRRLRGIEHGAAERLADSLQEALDATRARR